MTDLALGPWDDWGYLKHFDAVDAKENFCRATDTRTSEVTPIPPYVASLIIYTLVLLSRHRHPHLRGDPPFPLCSIYTPHPSLRYFH